MTLPILSTETDLLVIDQATGEALPVRDSTDRVLIEAVREVADLDATLYRAKRTIAAEMRHRHGVGVTETAGYRFTVAESTAWPARATEDALTRLVTGGHITEADSARAMPDRPRPDARALKALAGRLAVSDPDAARVLVEACTTSPASLRDVHADAIDEAA